MKHGKRQERCSSVFLFSQILNEESRVLRGRRHDILQGSTERHVDGVLIFLRNAYQLGNDPDNGFLNRTVPLCVLEQVFHRRKITFVRSVHFAEQMHSRFKFSDVLKQSAVVIQKPVIL